MRRYRALTVSTVTAAVVGLAIPAAAAWNDANFITVTPSLSARGDELTILVDAPECGTSDSTVSSPAFPTTQLEDMPDSNRVTATVRVHRNAGSGSYDVTARCDGRSLTERDAFTVIGGVEGGVGGSSVGATGTDIAIGGVLVAAALLGGGVVMMRRHAENRT
jgi:hypothetical protein